MEREHQILPECYIDTNLVNTLVGKSCNHQKGCPTVFKVMNERFKDSFALGVIDKDKREPKAIESFLFLCNNEYIYLYKHVTRPHYIIQVSPAEEVFILHAAEELGIHFSDFGLPEDMESLKQYTKKADAKSSSIFTSLFTVLKESPTFKTLNNLLNYLLANKYTADISILSNIIHN